ncbi:MAG: hypothetical protein ACEPOZ_00245 [Marinifilaceae bacterium]
MKRLSLIVLLAVFVLMGCNRNPLKVDVSDIEMDITVWRFDQDLFAVKNKESQELDQLSRKYGAYFDLYNYKVIQLGDPKDPRYPEYLQKFLNDPVMNEVYEKCQEVFPGFQTQKHALDNAFKHYKYYFPNRKIPQIFTHISGFNQSMVVAEDVLAISIDKYLGADCEFYERLGNPLYARYKMTPQRIPVDAIIALGLSEFSYDNPKDNVLGNLIYQGKVRYFTQAMMPDISEREIMGYKPEQIEWCLNNEDNIWGYLIEQKHLFSSEYRLIMRYINDGPFTQGLPQESPSRVGIWTGLQIVKSYMKQHPDVSLPQLMKETDYEKILRESGYQP